MRHYISREKLNEYLTINPLLDSLYTEIRTFALKKQDSVLSKFKVLAVNKVLERANLLLKDEPFAEFLDLLDIDSLPTYSDSVLVIANFKTALKAFQSKYKTTRDGLILKWNVAEESETEEEENLDD